MEDKTTIEILKSDHRTWKRWCRKKKLPSAKLINKIIEAGKNKVAFNNYMKSMTTRDDFKRPLEEVSICKKRRYTNTIERRGAYFV